MSVFLGDKRIRYAYIGSKKVSKIYLGSHLIYGDQVLEYDFMPKGGVANKQVYVVKASYIPADGIIRIPEKVLMIDPDGKPIECNVVCIQYQAFWGWPSIKQVILPDGLIYIDQAAFYQCYGLQKINIPRSVKEIGGNNVISGSSVGSVFAGCKNLTSATFDNTSGWSVQPYAGAAEKISATDLEDPTIAVGYLKTKYVYMRWFNETK